MSTITRLIEDGCVAGVKATNGYKADSQVLAYRTDDFSIAKLERRIEVVCIAAMDTGWNSQAQIVNPANIVFSCQTPQASDPGASIVDDLLGYVREFLHSPGIADVISAGGGGGLHIFPGSVRVGPEGKIPNNVLNIYQINLRLGAQIR